MDRKLAAFIGVGLIVALAVAGIVSFYASEHPDGLEYVAEEYGITDTEQDHPLGESIFADYGTAGVENERASVAVAGIVGTIVTFVVIAGVASLIVASRRRGQEADSAGPSPSRSGPGQPSPGPGGASQGGAGVSAGSAVGGSGSEASSASGGPSDSRSPGDSGS